MAGSLPIDSDRIGQDAALASGCLKDPRVILICSQGENHWSRGKSFWRKRHASSLTHSYTFSLFGLNSPIDSASRGWREIGTLQPFTTHERNTSITRIN